MIFLFTLGSSSVSAPANKEIKSLGANAQRLLWMAIKVKGVNLSQSLERLQKDVGISKETVERLMKG